MTKLKIPIILSLLLIAGCSSTSKQSKAEDARKAAETNASLGQQYMELGKTEVALEKLKRAVAHDKTYAPAHTLLGVLYESIGDMDEAGREYKKAVQYDPTDGGANNNYGAYLCGAGKREEAED